jgi:hypothetical protein
MSLFEKINSSIFSNNINLLEGLINNPDITRKNIDDAINLIYSKSPTNSPFPMKEHIGADPRDDYLATEQGKKILELLQNKLKSMSYKQKYLKYKLKYLNLKNKLI